MVERLRHTPDGTQSSIDALLIASSGKHGTATGTGGNGGDGSPGYSAQSGVTGLGAPNSARAAAVQLAVRGPNWWSWLLLIGLPNGGGGGFTGPATAAPVAGRTVALLGLGWPALAAGVAAAAAVLDRLVPRRSGVPQVQQQALEAAVAGADLALTSNAGVRGAPGYAEIKQVGQMALALSGSFGWAGGG